MELLRDIRSAFGYDDVIRSSDLVAKLTADPERPWAEWKHGRPLTQKQLAGLLAPFHIISLTVHPPGLPDGKGYRRIDLRRRGPLLPRSKHPFAAISSLSKRPSVLMPMKRAQLTISKRPRKSFGRQLVSQPCGFGRLDGSKSKVELERADGWLVGLHRECHQSTSTERTSRRSRPRARPRRATGFFRGGLSSRRLRVRAKGDHQPLPDVCRSCCRWRDRRCPVPRP